MLRAKREEDWQHTAWLAALIANVNRDERRKPAPFAPDDFNPMAGRKRPAGIEVNSETIADLRQMFMANHGRKGT